MKRQSIIRTLRLSALLLVATATSGCAAIYEDSDCVESATTFTFTYDMNIKFADAFGGEVKAVHALLFDTDGVLRYRWQVQQTALTEGNKLSVEVAPGDYDLLVWAGDYGRSAALGADGIVGASRLEDYHCRVHRGDDGHHRTHMEHFYHALQRVSLPYASPSDPHVEMVNLTKDTNNVHIILQQLSGQPVDMSELSITITDSNGWLNHDNSLRTDAAITYHPWHVTTGTVDIEAGENTAASKAQTLGAMTGALTVSRLTTDTNPVLSVHRKDGTKVLSVPLVDYALLVKGYYPQSMTDQEYLDRQDEYNMTFFLDEGLRWIDTRIVINDWVVVVNDENVQC